MLFEEEDEEDERLACAYLFTKMSRYSDLMLRRSLDMYSGAAKMAHIAIWDFDCS